MRLTAFLCLLINAPWLFGQNSTINIDRSLWRTITAKEMESVGGQKWITPNRYRAVTLEHAVMFQQLLQAPHEDDVLNNDATPLVMEFPDPEGGFARYEVYYFPIMHPDLQAQFPEIRTYAGKGIDDPNARIFFDMTPKGFHAMSIKGKKGAFFIDPTYDFDAQHYAVYYKKDYLKREDDRMVCLLGDETTDIKTPAEPATADFTNNCGVRREYRLAMACTGEYATFHGGTVALALAAINTSMNRVNGIFLTEASIKMNLIASNANIVYLNGASDPYTNNSGSAMLSENQTNCDAVIGSANYDVGHVFSTGGGGIATLQSPCNNSTKARGVTGSGSPVGDPFDVDYVAHEIGHQYNCPHTFSANSSGSCTTGTVSTANAFEPGSGSTIMAYAGICSPQNVQPNSDPYFHAGSLASMATFVTGGGHTCEQEISNGNTKPSVAALTTVNFPHSTPFVLNGSATDPNGHPLTYCWEQMNAAAVSPPAGTNTSGPLFRSYEAVSETYRYFPKYADVAQGISDPWEVLPTVGRTLTFRLTARDNQVTGGCTDEKNMDVVISGSAGPFEVTAPNGGETLTPGSNTTITWSVAGTTNSPISCANVDILYTTNSSDPSSYVTLVSNTPNDGTESVTVPTANSPLSRIMVRCHSTNGTYFYDISDADLTIGSGGGYCYTFTATNVPVAISAAAPNTVTSTLSVGGSTPGVISDVNVTNLTGTHTYISDLVVSLKSPAGTTRTLFGPVCGSQNDFNIKFNDAATNSYASIPCPPTSGLFYVPNNTLASFNGQSPIGTWTLTVQDVANGDGGSLTGWEIQICLTEELSLPVELLSFAANKAGNTAELQWATAQERNNAGFAIERSAGNTLNFEDIGFVEPSKDGQSIKQYRFTDDAVRLGETYYYRLRQTDHGGEVAYSNIEKVSFGSGPEWTLAPNPANSILRVSFPNPNEEEVTIKVTQPDGREMFSGPVTSGQALQTANWPVGTYYVSLASARYVSTKKVQITH